MFNAWCLLSVGKPQGLIRLALGLSALAATKFALKSAICCQPSTARTKHDDFGQKRYVTKFSRIGPDTEQAIRRFIALIAGRFDLAGAIVFGSRARGTHRPDSDAECCRASGRRTATVPDDQAGHGRRGF